MAHRYDFHPEASGVEPTEQSPWTTARHGNLSITSVLVEDRGIAEIEDLPRPTRERPAVYCPFCGQPGSYRRGSVRRPHFAHGHGLNECSVLALETVRHRRAKEHLAAELRRAGNLGLPVRALVDCRRCKVRRAVATVLGPGDIGIVTTEKQCGPRQPDVSVRGHAGELSGLFEVRATNPLDEERLADLRTLAPGLELLALGLWDTRGPTWTVEEPLTGVEAHWGVESAAFHVCESCRQLPPQLDEALRALERAGRHHPRAYKVRENLAVALGILGDRESFEASVRNLRLAWAAPERLRNILSTEGLNRVADRPPFRHSDACALLMDWFEVQKRAAWSEVKNPSLLRQQAYVLLEQHTRESEPTRAQLALAETLSRSVSDQDRQARALCITRAIVRWFGGHTGVTEPYFRHRLARLGLGIDPEDWRTVLADAGTAVVHGRHLICEREASRRARQLADSILQRVDQQTTPCRLGSVPAGLTDEQADAVALAQCQPVFVLTGRAGTGKSRVIQALCAQTRNKWYACAPTWKAASRLKQLGVVCGATSVHEFLETAHSLDPADRIGVVVDEASMLDVELARQLFRLECLERVVLVGDGHQLGSVQPGAVLRDILDVDRVKRVELTKRFRGSSRTGLLAAADDILGGRVPQPSDSVRIVEHCGDWVRATISSIQNPAAQVLCATNADCDAISRARRFPGAKRAAGDLFVGDPVFVDDHRCERFGMAKGTTGRLAGKHGDDLVVEVNGATHAVPARCHEWLLPAWALTVHRAQGSEWDYVVYAQSKPRSFVERRLLYTAATRSAVGLAFVVPHRSLESAVRRATRRITVLPFFLRRAENRRACQERPAVAT